MWAPAPPTERRRGMRWRGASDSAVAGGRKARGVGRGAARHLVAQPIVERVDVRGEAARRDVGQLHHHAGDARGAAGAGTADGGGGRGVGGRAPGEVEAVLQRQGRCSKACPGGRPARRVSRQMERQSARPNSERPRSAYARPRIAWPGDGCRTQSRGRRSWRNRPWAAEAGGGVTGGGGNGGR